MEERVLFALLLLVVMISMLTLSVAYGGTYKYLGSAQTSGEAVNYIDAVSDGQISPMDAPAGMFGRAGFPRFIP